MQADVFDSQMRAIAATPAEHRRRALSEFHYKALPPYLFRLDALTPADACRISSDGRTVAQVVGHIFAWERYTIQAVGEMLTGVTWPRIMEMQDYVEDTGRTVDFHSVDDFNAYLNSRIDFWPWDQLQHRAGETALTLYRLFSDEELLPTRVIEATRPYPWQLLDGSEIEVTVGWYLWMVSLRHALVEHATDLAPVGQMG